MNYYPCEGQHHQQQDDGSRGKEISGKGDEERNGVAAHHTGHNGQQGHDELLAAKGKYYSLYMTQFAGNAI